MRGGKVRSRLRDSRVRLLRPLPGRTVNEGGAFQAQSGHSPGAGKTLPLPPVWAGERYKRGRRAEYRPAERGEGQAAAGGGRPIASPAVSFAWASPETTTLVPPTWFPPDPLPQPPSKEDGPEGRRGPLGETHGGNQCCCGFLFATKAGARIRPSSKARSPEYRRHGFCLPGLNSWPGQAGSAAGPPRRAKGPIQERFSPLKAKLSHQHQYL